MVSITLSVPEELKIEMDKHPDMNWSAIAREAIKNRLILLIKFNEFTAKSKLTEKDAIELGRKINKSMYQRYKKEYPNEF